MKGANYTEHLDDAISSHDSAWSSKAPPSNHEEQFEVSPSKPFIPPPTEVIDYKDPIDAKPKFNFLHSRKDLDSVKQNLQGMMMGKLRNNIGDMMKKNMAAALAKKG